MPLYEPITPLVGRDDDLSRLRRGLAIPGAGGIVLLSGDAGIGKSRVMAAAAHAAADEGVLVAAGYCVGLAGAPPAYLPFADLIGELAAAEPHVVAAVAAAHPALGRLLPDLVPELHSGPRPPGEGAAPDVRPDPLRMAAAVHACLEAVARRRPLLAVVEDVHWADASSRDLLTVLFTRGFAGPVALVVSYRSDDLHRRHPLHETLGVWARLPRVGRLDLGGLPDAAMRALVGGLAGAPRDPALVADVVARAEGNAFFAEELIAGGAALSGDLGRVLWLRVESLSEDARTAVRTVAVGGRRVPAELLGAVTELAPEPLDAALREAIDRHLLLRAGEDLAFRHALLAEAAYDDLLPAERTRRHAAYAAALQTRPGLGTAADLARHAHAAGDAPVAVAAAVRAGREAMGMGGPADALEHFERALTWMPVDHPDRDELTERAAGAASACGNTLRAFQLVRDRVEHPGPHTDDERRAGMLALLAMKARILDSPFDDLGTTAEAMALLPAGADGRLQCRVRLARLQALVDDDRYAESLALADEISRLAEGYDLPRVAIEARAILARVIESELDAAAMGAHLEAVRAELAGTDDAVLVRVCHNLAGVYHREGDLAKARELLAEGRAVAERRQRPWAPWATECRLLEGVYSFELGDWDRAAALLDVPVTLVSDLRHALIASAGLVLAVARGETVSEADLNRLGQWWPYDGLVTLLTCVGGVEALASAGDPTGAVHLVAAGVDVLDRIWGSTYQAIVRLAAVAAGACAEPAGFAAEDRRAEILDVLAPLIRRARDRVAAGDHYIGAESRAWAARLEAEWSRLLRHVSEARAARPAAEAMPAGDSGAAGRAAAIAAPAPDEVAAWHVATEAMADYGHVYETARSRTRLAEALLATRAPGAAGQLAEALQLLRAAREVAARLGAAPLLSETDDLLAGAEPDVDPVPPAGEVAAGALAPNEATRLTPRELEVLRRLALGETNGQIGKALYITTKTASVHVSNLLAKLGAPTRGAAVAEALRRGLL